MYKEFIEKLIPFFEKEGFQWVKSIKSFTRKFALGAHRFQIDSETFGLYASTYYGIKFKEIDKKLGQAYNIKVSSKSLTLFITVSNLLEHEEGTFPVENDTEMEIGVNKVINTYTNYALPYFNNYSTYEAIDKLINGQEIEEKKFGNDKFHGSTRDAIITRLIVAKILKKDNYEDLEKYYLNYGKNKGWREDIIQMLLDNIQRLKSIYPA